jgi:putative transposase
VVIIELNDKEILKADILKERNVFVARVTSIGIF